MRVLFLSQYLAQEPLGVMYLSGALKQAGHETKMIFLPDTQFEQKVKEFDPAVVAFSFTTGLDDPLYEGPVTASYERVHRAIPDTHSDSFRTPVTIHSGHPLRFIPDTDSD